MYLDALNSGLIVLDEDVGFLSVGNYLKLLVLHFLQACFHTKYLIIRKIP